MDRACALYAVRPLWWACQVFRIVDALLVQSRAVDHKLFEFVRNRFTCRTLPLQFSSYFSTESHKKATQLTLTHNLVYLFSVIISILIVHYIALLENYFFLIKIFMIKSECGYYYYYSFSSHSSTKTYGQNYFETALHSCVSF